MKGNILVPIETFRVVEAYDESGNIQEYKVFSNEEAALKYKEVLNNRGNYYDVSVVPLTYHDDIVIQNKKVLYVEEA